MKLSKALSFVSSIIMGFTVLDAICYLLTNRTLAQFLIGGESPLSQAIFEIMPGMSPAEFFAANAIVLGAVTALLFVSVYGTLKGNNFEDTDSKTCYCDYGSLERDNEVRR